MKEKEKNFKLEIPIDASGIEGFKPEQGIRVAVKSRDGSINEEKVKLDAKGKGKATFTFLEAPGALQVVIGPETASAAELFGMQTIGFNLSARRWEDGMELILHPIPISAYYWYWWLRWCRTFTIRGHVVCPNGNPVPGAKVCASDVDMWWWWCSKQQMGCATTDANGAFEIKFRWCCGWLPWWWWAHRVWQLDPNLVERIMPVLQSDLKLRKIPVPSPQPDLAIFEELLAEQVRPQRQSQAAMVTSAARAMVRVGSDFMHQTKSVIDSAALERLSVRLKERITVVPGFERLHIWPWWPWHPWWDCTPDIIFQVTQNCKGVERVIVNEGCLDTRWNIPTTLDVTLIANEEACCVTPPLPEPEGNCVEYTTVCTVDPSDQINKIGGNLGASATPAGYLNPGASTAGVSGQNYNGDRPYAGVVDIFGVFGDTADVDYYEFQWSNDGGLSWNDMPSGAQASLGRGYIGNPGVFGEPGLFHSHEFLTTVGGRTVYETRRHFEANPGWTAVLHLWLSNTDLLLRWSTNSLNFADGTYMLRLKGWKWNGVSLTPAAGGVATDQEGILPLCIGPEGETKANYIVITIDNRLYDAGVIDHPPSTPSHPCGFGTVHTCTLEPDTDIISVKIIHKDGRPDTDVKACGNIPIAGEDEIQIDFMVTDLSGHLAFYTLDATYGENQLIPLIRTDYPDKLQTLRLTAHPATLASLSPGGAQVGPNYGHLDPLYSTLSQGATPPHWYGGYYRFKARAIDIFPVTCCYQLELRAHKRTIVNCDHSFWAHWNLSEYSFMIVV